MNLDDVTTVIKNDWADFRARWPKYKMIDRVFIVIFLVFGTAKMLLNITDPFDLPFAIGLVQVLLGVEIAARCRAEYQRDQNFRLAVALTKVIIEGKDATVDIVDMPDGSTSVKIDATRDRRT